MHGSTVANIVLACVVVLLLVAVVYLARQWRLQQNRLTAVCSDLLSAEAKFVIELAEASIAQLRAGAPADQVAGTLRAYLGKAQGVVSMYQNIDTYCPTLAGAARGRMHSLVANMQAALAASATDPRTALQNLWLKVQTHIMDMVQSGNKLKTRSNTVCYYLLKAELNYAYSTARVIAAVLTNQLPLEQAVDDIRELVGYMAAFNQLLQHFDECRTSAVRQRVANLINTIENVLQTVVANTDGTKVRAALVNLRSLIESHVALTQQQLNKMEK